MTKTITVEGSKFKVITQDELTDKLVKTLERNLESICKYEIYEDYLWESILESDLFTYHQTKSGQINGIMMMDIHKSYLYIEMICSKKKGIGSKLLKVAEKVAKKYKKRTIKLTSVDGAEKFYMKKGYIHSTRPCVKRPKIKRKFDVYEDGYPMAKCIG